MTIQADDPVLDHLAESGYDQNYGARPLRRAIQNEVEDAMAEEILDGKLKNGDHIHMSMNDGHIEFCVKN